MTRKELSEIVAEAAARTEQAAARTETARAGIEVARQSIEVSRAGIEAARKRQEEAIARQEVATAKLQEYEVLVEKRMAENEQWTKRIFAELDSQRDERRALLEAIFRVLDRLPPPPPDLRSA